MTKKDIIPNSVDWEITHKCNLNCKFCFGPNNEKLYNKDLSVKQLLHIAKKLIDSGLKKAVITGGEPLLRSDIFKLLEFLKYHRVNIVLSTNGYYVKENLSTLLKHIDWIALPLDGVTSDTSSLMRCDPNHHKIITDLLKNFFNKSINIKIGTVVTKYNYLNLYQIGNVLQNYKINIWKLYQFSPRGRGKIFMDELDINYQAYLNATHEVKMRFPNMNILISQNSKRDYAYYLIRPNGIVVTPYKDKYIEIGNILHQEIHSLNWKDVINNKKLENNFNSTYKRDDL